MTTSKPESSARVSGADGVAPVAPPTCKLASVFGRPRPDWTVEDLIDLVREQRIGVVSLMHVASDGALKTLDFAPRSVAHLRDVIEGGERADGSSLFAGAGIPVGASDVLLRPRPSSAFLDPFAAAPTLVLLAGHAGRDGEPLPESPDTIVRAAAARVARELGLELQALGEVECFLGRRWTEEDIYGANDHGYHASSPFVFGEALRRQALALLAEIGVPVKYAHSEVGYIAPSDLDDTLWEQHEVELALTPLPEAADHVVVTQWVLRNLAHRHRMRCSFDPIMRKGHVGSGLHFHLSPVERGDHQPTRTLDGRLTPSAQWLIAGLVQHGGALMAFGNRRAGSFIRISQAKEAPGSVTWGAYDRLALIRLPVVAQTADGRMTSPPTVEFRLPDGSAHPHLLLAGVAQAMVAGRQTPEIDDLLARTSVARIKEAPGDVAPLPRSFREIGHALAARRDVLTAGGVFPARLLDNLVAALSG